MNLIFFSKASGLVVNSNKSEILYVHDSNNSSVDGIKVKCHVKYLGVDICRSDSDRLHHNFQPRLDNIKKCLCCWLQRDLTIYGRVLLTKAEGISRLVYPAFSLYVDQKTIKSINSLLFRFIWKNKTECVQLTRLSKLTGLRFVHLIMSYPGFGSLTLSSNVVVALHFYCPVTLSVVNYPLNSQIFINKP